MPKQTAVEWLLQRFEDGDMYNVEDAQFIKHQALAMEKEQIEDAYGDALNGHRVNYCDRNDYYNKTYASSPKTSDN